MVRSITKTTISVTLLVGILFLTLLIGNKVSAATLYEAPCKTETGHVTLTQPFTADDGKTYACARDIKGEETFAANADGTCFLGLPSFDNPFGSGKLCLKGDEIKTGNSTGSGQPLRKVNADCESTGALTTGNCQLLKYVVAFTRLLSALVGIVVVIMIIVGGIQYSSAGSDPSKVAAAKSKIFNALLALVLFIFMFGLLQWLVPGGVF